VQFFKSRKKLKTYQSENPNEKLELSLNELKWQHAESDKKAWEWIKKKSIDNFFLKQAIEKMDYRFKLGEFTYINYARRLERTSPSITCKRKHNPFWKIVKA